MLTLSSTLFYTFWRTFKVLLLCKRWICCLLFSNHCGPTNPALPSANLQHQADIPEDIVTPVADMHSSRTGSSKSSDRPTTQNPNGSKPSPDGYQLYPTAGRSGSERNFGDFQQHEHASRVFHVNYGKDRRLSNWKLDSLTSSGAEFFKDLRSPRRRQE